jgi:hypothetical protein
MTEHELSIPLFTSELFLPETDFNEDFELEFKNATKRWRNTLKREEKEILRAQ